jgi:hypothetical protein
MEGFLPQELLLLQLRNRNKEMNSCFIRKHSCKYALELILDAGLPASLRFGLFLLTFVDENERAKAALV